MQSQSLRQVIDYMYLMMPNVTHPQLSISKEEYALYKQALSAVKLVMLRYSKSPYIPSTKITEALRTLLTTPSGIKLHTDKLIVWKVCGIDTNIASNKWPLSLRGASTEGMRRHEDPASGYTCGLWMMFHYLTIQGEVFSQNQYNISALETMQTIHDFIEIYFGCKDCR